MPTAIDDRLTDTFAALANPTRRAILARLAHGGATVNEIAEPFGLTLPAVSKHIKVLEKAGLLVRGTRRAVPPVRSRRRAARRRLDVDGTVPPGVGVPSRPDGRLPRSAPVPAHGRFES